ncbi:PREDICTED: GATA transcription factor 23-like [Brassica oleracea var. oleracea]|nr:PREDICTED: GATA transcription factor 23-like [Brassica oleracea var. oleracea]
MEEEKKTVRCCSERKTTKTPMWRGGPSCPKSLCNACGIRLRKQRRSELLGIRIIHSHKAYKKINPSPSSLSFSHGGVFLKKRRILKEEEQAALCLLLLSRNSAFA